LPKRSLQPETRHPDSGGVRSSVELPPEAVSDVDTLRRRLQFLELADDEAQTLQSLIPEFEQFESQFVDAFYDHLRQFPATAAFLEDPVRFERLKQAQRRHFRTMLEAKWDAEYAAARRRVGDVHADVGIEPQYFIGAYFQYIQHSLRHAQSPTATAAERQRCETTLTLLKAVFLDIGLTLDAYFAQSTLKLQNALDLLWRANKDLQQFAHLTSHDLKTPLATVANLCEETLDEFGEQLPEEARNLITSARQRVFRMSAMIDELLSSTVVSESIDDREALDPGKSIHEALERVKPEATKKKVSVDVQLSPHQAWGNHVRLREAVFNLLSNAVKFVPEHEGIVRVTSECRDGAVRIAVSDNGPGIPKEDLLRVFAPFVRLSVGRTEPGTGLGLYFAKNLVEALGGRLWVESSPGVGSTFFIEIPAA